MAHGQTGQVSFDSGPLSLETVNDHPDELAAIGRALGENGTLLLWTCRTAQGERGHAFVKALEHASGAMVAATTTLLGAQDKGGCWELDTQIGRRETLVPLTPAGQMNYGGVMATFNGTNGDDTADATNGTLIGFTGGTAAELQDATGDTFNPGGGADTVVASSGDDTINGFLGADSVDGGAGTDDTLLLTSGPFTDLASATDGQLTNVEIINATSAIGTLNFANQTEGFIINGGPSFLNLTGSAGADTITTGGSTDTITGGSGHDTINGGLGTDKVILSGIRSDYTITLIGSTYTIEDTRPSASDGTDTVTNVENLQFADATFTTATLDATPPTVSSVTYSSHDGTLKAGEMVTIIVTFSENVTVAGGTPTLTLDSGGTGTLTSGSGTNALTFTYTVASGDNTADLAVTAFNLNGATVKDAQGNNANTTGAVTNPTGVLVVDTIPPEPGTLALAAFTDSGTNSSDGVSSDNTFDLNLTGQESGATVAYEVSTDGGTNWTTTTVAQTALADGSYQFRAQVSDLAGNGSTSNVVTVTVDTTTPTAGTLALANFTDSGTSSSDFISTDNTFDLSLTGSESGSTVTYDVSTDGGNTWTPTTAAQSALADGSYQFRAQITDLAGNTNLSNSVNVTVDTTVPAITSATTAPAIDENSGASQVVYTVTATDGPSTSLSYSLGTGSDEGAFTINGSTGEVTLTDNPDYETKASYSFTVSATDPAGNAASQLISLAITDLNEGTPTVSNVAITSASGSQNSTLNTGDTLSVTVTMSEVVLVTGVPQVALNIGGTTVHAHYDSGSGTAQLVFTYTIQSGEADTDGISIDANSLSLNGGTIKNAADTVAILTHSAVGDNSAYMVDTATPAVPTVDALSTTDTTPVISGTATLGSGEQLAVSVNGATYSNVSVTGGNWSIDTGTVTPSSGTLGTFIPGNTYSITATVTDTAGNATSDGTTNELVITSTVPTTTATLTNMTETTANSPSSTSLTLSGTLSAALVAGEMVKVSDGATFLGNAVVSGITWSYTNASTSAGSHTFNVEVANATGHSATSSASVIAGTTGNNSGGAALNGTSAGEYVFGFAGIDTINGFAGSDTVTGGRSTDKLVLTATSSDLNNASNNQLVNVEEVSAVGALAGVTIDLHNQTETFTITGSGNADTITGGSGMDTITGGAGADIVNGGAGTDKLNGEAGGDSFIGGTGSDIINVGVLNDDVQDRVQFFNTSEFGDTVSNFDSTGSTGVVDLVDFGGLLTTAFDDIPTDGNFAWITGNGSDGGNTDANLNTTVEALYLTGTNGEGVSNKDLTKATAVANEFNAEFNVTAGSGQDALLVVNATNSNNFALYSYLESGSGAEIQGTELTLIGVFNSNGDVVTGQFDFI